METIKRTVTKYFVWSMILTVLFVFGIPLTVFGAVYGLWLLMALGIAFIVVGFYGMPIIWTAYGSVRSYKKVIYCIVELELETLDSLADHLRWKKEDVLDKLDTCIRNNYLVGYVRSGESVSKVVRKKGKTAVYLCESCGATFEVEVVLRAECPYCGRIAK